MGTTPARSAGLRYFAAFIGTLIVVLGILDVVSTNLVLEAGGVEMNPIVALWMDHLNDWWHLPKLAIHIVAAFLIYFMLYTRLTATVALVVVFLYGLIVHHNFSLVSAV